MQLFIIRLLGIRPQPPGKVCPRRSICQEVGAMAIVFETRKKPFSMVEGNLETHLTKGCAAHFHRVVFRQLKPVDRMVSPQIASRP
jgi:hypothetical protein